MKHSKIRLLFLMTFLTVSSIGFGQTKPQEFYEIKLHINSLIMGEDILKLNSDVLINTKNKTIEYTEYIPELGQEVKYSFYYLGYSEDGFLVTINFKLNSEYSSMGKIAFNMVNNKMQIVPPDYAGENRPGGLYNITMTSKAAQ
jgi:hypothetical protein